MRQYTRKAIAIQLRKIIRANQGQITNGPNGLQITQNGLTAELPRQSEAVSSRFAQNR